MILKANPDKVLRFMVENFELVRSLYLAQLAGNVISREQFNALTKHTGDISANRLFEYKLLTEQYDDIRLNEPVRAFLAFLISEFKPLLPSELEKYRTSFRELFTAVQECPEENNPSCWNNWRASMTRCSASSKTWKTTPASSCGRRST